MKNNIIKEGSVSIQAGEAFYNPKMKKLRDISIVAVKAFGGKPRILDATAATGIRAIRYAKETKAEKVVALDMNEAAYKAMKSNVRRNRAKVRPVLSSIQRYANTTDEWFDVIDLDPFGSPAPCTYDIMKVSRPGTVLMVTATDTAVLCGAHADACLKVYASKPMHNELCKESGIRILTNFILRNAAQFNFGIEPLLSISDMHYMRVFLRLDSGAKAVKESVKSVGFAAFCTKCRNFSTSKGLAASTPNRCGNCSSAMQAYGPMWLGNLYDKGFVEKMLGIFTEKYEGKKEMEIIRNEIDTPFFYSVPALTKSLKKGSVSPNLLAEKLTKNGMRTSKTQFDKDAIKTVASTGDVLKQLLPL